MSAGPGESIATIAHLIWPALQADERVRFAYLFGSLARGEARPDSDIDIAVLTRARGTLLDDARLQDELAAALGRDDVDLLVLGDAPLWLRYRVVAGEVVFSRDERARIAFREWTEKEFLDFRPYHDSYLKAIRDRAQRGALSGVDRERIDESLALLARCVRILRQLAVIPLEDYCADPRNFGSAERFLQLAIERMWSPSACTNCCTPISVTSIASPGPWPST